MPPTRPARGAVERARRAVESAASTLPGRVLARLVEVGGFDRSIILAAQAFTAMLPLLIVVSTIAQRPGDDSPAAELAGKVSLSRQGLAAIQGVITPPASARASTGLVGALLVVLTAASFSKALQRNYELAWRLPRAGLRHAWRPLAWIVGFALYVVLLAIFSRLVRGLPAGTLLEDAGAFLGATVLWAATQWLLLGGRVRLRLLVPGGLLTAVGFVLWRRASALYLPYLVHANEQRYGLLGVAFTLFTWLSVCSLIIVVATVVGAVLAEEPGRLGGYIRKGTPMTHDAPLRRIRAPGSSRATAPASGRAGSRRGRRGRSPPPPG